MTKINKSEKIDHGRRRLLGAATISAAVAQLGLTRSARAQSQSSALPPIKPGTNTSFGPLKQIDETITGGIGHNLPQEAPHAFAEAVVDVTKA